MTDRLDIPNPTWMSQANCKDLPTSWFFPKFKRGGNVKENRFVYDEEVERAKEVCALCVVKEECLTHALLYSEYGIWGGLTADERREL